MHEEMIRNSRLLRTLRSVLSLSQKSFLIRSVNFFRKEALHRRQTPGAVVLFVTNRCQMGCDFCLYKEQLNISEPVLSLQEITKLARSLKHLPRLVLTGGEPFLRDDLDDICRRFNQRAKTRFISIPTNGFMTQRTRDMVGKILGATKLNVLKIQISIDALGSEHDETRRTKRAFDNAVATLTALQGLQRKHGNLYVEIACVVNRSLINDIQAFVDHFQDFRVPIKFCLVRSDDFGLFGLGPEDADGRLPGSDAGQLSLEELERFYHQLKEINERSAYKFWPLFQQLKYKNSLTVLSTRQRVLPCYAGKMDAVVYHNGDLAFCENTRPIGNLKEYDFDFRRLWQSSQADAFRKKITKCACIHGCNLVTAMSYDDKTLVSIGNLS